MVELRVVISNTALTLEGLPQPEANLQNVLSSMMMAHCDDRSEVDEVQWNLETRKSMAFEECARAHL